MSGDIAVDSDLDTVKSGALLKAQFGNLPAQALCVERLTSAGLHLVFKILVYGVEVASLKAVRNQAGSWTREEA